MAQFLNNRRKRSRIGAWLAWGLWAAGCAALAPRVGGWGALALLVMGSGVLLVRTRPRRVPVLNYHSVSAQPQWLGIGSRISLPPETFARQLAWLAHHGYRTLFVSEVAQLLEGSRTAPAGAPCVALTFDDGYADNATTVWPLLRQYHMKATFFVSTDFIADAPPAEGDAGYLTWAQLRELQAGGLVEIQSHGAAHARVMADERLRGFVGPDRPNPWLLWNTRPETRRTWWRELPRDRSLWGHPVYQQQPALAAREFRLNPQAVAHLLAWTRAQGEALFARPDWEQTLRAEWSATTARLGGPGAWESAADFAARVADDLRQSRAVLQRELGRPVTLLCWPENAFTPEGEALARAAGYVATVANGHDTQNAVGRSPGRIARVCIGAGFIGRPHPVFDLLGFVVALRVFEGWYGYYPVQVLAAALRRAGLLLRRKSVCPPDYYTAWG